MIEMVIWLVVIAAFVFQALKKNGTLDELFAGAKKRKENKAERVVYEQPEEGSGKKEKKKKKKKGKKRNRQLLRNLSLKLL